MEDEIVITMLKGVGVRLMEPADLPALHAIYQSNIADFLPDDMELVRECIQETSPNYFVIEINDEVVAGGGVELAEGCNDATLYMGIVRRDLHGQELGTLLMLLRLAWTDGNPGRVWLMTHEKTRGFYERFGFRKVSDHLRAGLPRFSWYTLQLDESAREVIKSRLRENGFGGLLDGNTSSSPDTPI
ncbi:MAG: GNAT family N-acetyltransferase [Kiritimatiellia bacterium]